MNPVTVTVTVTSCADCPFVDYDKHPPQWLCTATADSAEDWTDYRDLGKRQEHAGAPWLPPPDWFPLRTADRLVTLRVP